MTDADKSTVGAIETSLSLVDALITLDGARISELAEVVSVAPSTVHRHLTTLREQGFVVKNGDEYAIGLRFLTVGGYARRRNPAYELAKEKTKQLAEETNERAQFIVEEQGRRVYLYHEFGEDAVHTDGHVGVRGYLHTSAAGKALLATLPDSRIEEIIQTHGLPAPTDQSITDLEELFEELERIRSSGVAFNDEESSEGLRAVSVAVTDQNARPLGALSVSGPAYRLTGDWYESELPDLILGFANEIELNIKYM